LKQSRGKKTSKLELQSFKVTAVVETNQDANPRGRTTKGLNHKKLKIRIKLRGGRGQAEGRVRGGVKADPVTDESSRKFLKR